jgi:hypothetical protein
VGFLVVGGRGLALATRSVNRVVAADERAGSVPVAASAACPSVGRHSRRVGCPLVVARTVGSDHPDPPHPAGDARPRLRTPAHKHAVHAPDRGLDRSVLLASGNLSAAILAVALLFAWLSSCRCCLTSSIRSRDARVECQRSGPMIHVLVAVATLTTGQSGGGASDGTHGWRCAARCATASTPGWRCVPRGGTVAPSSSDAEYFLVRRQHFAAVFEFVARNARNVPDASRSVTVP